MTLPDLTRAREMGSYLYWGSPCKYGHTPVRYTKYGHCVTCERLRRNSLQMWQRAYAKRHYQENRQDYIERAASWKQENPQRRKEIVRQWGRDNPLKRREERYRRIAAQLQRTPAWADQQAIKQVYLNCPDGFEVDHIIPLRGKLVSGLHIANNLQYLTPEDNMKKLNKFDPWTFIP